MSKSAKKRPTASAPAAVPTTKSSRHGAGDPEPKRADRGSKQSRVIALLQSPTGATIEAMMKATGWQPHSVRGFLAGVVRKRLKLKLGWKKVDGNRVYQIASGDRGKTTCPRNSTPRLRACVISTLVSFAAVGIPHSAGQRPLTLLVISCFAAWRTGCRPTVSGTWMGRISVCSIGRGRLRRLDGTPWI